MYSGTNITKEISNNKVTFTLEELLINNACEICLPTIHAVLCSGGENPCSGYPFFFPFSEKFGNRITVDLSSTAIEYFPESNYSPSSTCSDRNLIYCSQLLFSPDKNYSSPIKAQTQNFSEENGIKKCDNLGKIPGIDGTYIFETFCSNGLNSILNVQPFIQRIVEIKNPYNNYVIAVVNLSKTSCIFKNGSKINNFSLNPNENLPEIVSCLNEKEDMQGTEINLFPITIKNNTFSLISITPTLINISLFGGISLAIFFIYKKIKKNNSHSPSTNQ